MGSWPPAPLRHPRFELWPSDPAMNAADFEAVMSSREMLQRWSASPWPEAGFTLAENAEDLAAHQADHRAGRIFGYNLTEPGGAGCLGSVYIRPNPPWAEDYVLTPATPGATLEGLDLKVELWVRSDTGDLEAVVLEALRVWFTDAWGARPAFAVRPAHHERLALFRAGGFALVAHLGDDEGGVGSLLFAPPEALRR